MEISISVKNRQFDIDEIQSKPYKRQKGESVLLIPDDYTVIDLETTGLNPKYDSIIEAACIKYRAGNEVDRFHSLVQPPSNGTGNFVDDFITDLTGITNDMLENAPVFTAIVNELWNFLSDEFLVGHNVNFDINFLYDNFQQNGNLLLKNDFLDTLRLARRVLPNLKHHRLCDLADYFEINSEHHHALDDCLTTDIIMQRLSEIVHNTGIDLNQYNKVYHQIDLRAIKGDVSKFSSDHPFYDRHCVFTGKLERFTRKEAAQLVANIGGHCDNGVNKQTNFLIVGDLDYSANIKDGKSTKLKKAEKLILGGQDLQIITEGVFYDLLTDTLKNIN